QADGVGSLLAEGLREEVRPVIEFTGGGEDAILSALRDGARRRRIIEYGRDGPRRQSYVIRHSFQSYGGRVFRAWVSIFRHGDVRLLADSEANCIRDGVFAPDRCTRIVQHKIDFILTGLRE